MRFFIPGLIVAWLIISPAMISRTASYAFCRLMFALCYAQILVSFLKGTSPVPTYQSWARWHMNYLQPCAPSLSQDTCTPF